MAGEAQQQLIAARRNQILTAAAAVFAEQGFHATTIREVARRAGVADGTIYNYFGNKGDLLLGIFDRMREAIMRENAPPVPGETTLRAAIAIFLSHPLGALGRDNLALFRIVISETMVNAELRARYNEQILGPTLAVAESFLHAQAVAQGLRPRPEDVQLAVRIIAGLVMGLLVGRAMDDETLRARWEDLPELLADLIAKSLGGPA